MTDAPDVAPVPCGLPYLAGLPEESSGCSHKEIVENIGMLYNRQRPHSTLGEDSPAEVNARTTVGNQVSTKSGEGQGYTATKG